MDPKPVLRSRTFWSIVLTAAVLAAGLFVPEQFHSYLQTAEQVLILSGLWFARLGGGRPIGKAS